MHRTNNPALENACLEGMVAAAPSRIEENLALLPPPMQRLPRVIRRRADGPAACENAQLCIVLRLPAQFASLAASLDLQDLTPAAAEWLLLVEDGPDGWAAEAYLARRLDSLTRPTRLLSLNGPCNMGQALHLSLQESAATYILWIEPHVYLRDFEAVLRALRLVQSERTIGACGFTLQNPQGGVRAGELQVVLDPRLGGIPVLRALGNGLLAADGRGDREVALVDGDMMLLPPQQRTRLQQRI